MRKYFYCILVLLFAACVDKFDKHDFKQSYHPCDNTLTMELYTVFGSGASGGDLMSAYLTDSTDFRMYLGTFDNAAQGIFCECHGDTVLVKDMKTINGGRRELVKTRVFSIKELKKNRKFE